MEKITLPLELIRKESPIATRENKTTKYPAPKLTLDKICSWRWEGETAPPQSPAPPAIIVFSWYGQEGKEGARNEGDLTFSTKALPENGTSRISV